MAKTYKTMPKGCDENGYFCLFPDFSEKAFSFSTLNIILAVDFSQIAFIMLKYVPSIPTLSTLNLQVTEPTQLFIDFSFCKEKTYLVAITVI